MRLSLPWHFIFEQSERPFVQTGRYCTVHIYNISIPTVCASNMHTGTSSKCKCQCCVSVCLHMFVQMCVFIRLSDMLAVL